MMTKAVLRWLLQYRKQVADDPKSLNEVRIYISEYSMLKSMLNERINDHHDGRAYDEKMETLDEAFLLSQIIEVERTELARLWEEQKISLELRNKLLNRLDHRSRHLA